MIKENKEYNMVVGAGLYTALYCNTAAVEIVKVLEIVQIELCVCLCAYVYVITYL